MLKKVKAKERNEEGKTEKRKGKKAKKLDPYSRKHINYMKQI